MKNRIFWTGSLGLLFLLFPACRPAPQATSSEPAPLPGSPHLLVLGVAQDAGYPQAGCRKACCDRVWRGETAGRYVACLALVDPGAKQAWLFDATPSFREQLRELEDRGLNLAGIFLTHAHIGHYTGLMQLGHEAMGARNVPVYAMPRMKAYLETNAKQN